MPCRLRRPDACARYTPWSAPAPEQFSGGDEALGPPAGRAGVGPQPCGWLSSCSQHLGDETCLAAASRDIRLPSGRASSTSPSSSTMSAATSPAASVRRRCPRRRTLAAHHRLRKPQCPPQSSRLIEGHTCLLGDLQPGIAALPGEQSPGDHLRRRDFVVRCEVYIGSVRQPAWLAVPPAGWCCLTGRVHWPGPPRVR